MKVVILAGGLGACLSEQTMTRLKPLVEDRGHRSIWHIMKHYAPISSRPPFDC
jgi:glucose-1-phosphate cytidylyltransferase